MKSLALTASIIAFAFSTYYFGSNLRYSDDLNYIVYMLTWLILMFISIIGIIYNVPALSRRKRHFKALFTIVILNGESGTRNSIKNFTF
jgi:hypothetical protein